MRNGDDKVHQRHFGLSSRDVHAVVGSGHREEGRPLSQLHAGETARIVSLRGSSDPAAARRLFDLGFVPGGTVECVRRAPLGDPTIFRVADFEIALRRAQSETIVVTA